MPHGIQQALTMDLSVDGGVNTVSQPTALGKNQARKLLNGYMPQGRIGPCAKRMGTLPVTTAALASAIGWLCVYRNGATDRILATSGTSLYWLNGTALTAAIGALNNSDIYETDFTDANNNARKIIADKASLKAYNDATTTVAAITPAADDAAPNPANILATVNGKGIKYCFAYQGHVFVSDGSDTWWYTKRWTFDYIPSTQWIRWVKSNDFMNGPGMAFDNVCLLPMRRSWGLLTGDKVDTFVGNLFLNTVNGVIAPRSIARIMYPDGSQTIAYLSDDGPYEIYDTGSLDSGSRRYATRPLMLNKVDFNAIGLSDTEKQGAVGYFDSSLSLYILKFNHGTDRLVYAYDTRNREWYPWNNIKANAFIRSAGILYYAGETGLVHQFDATLGSDWNESTKTTGTPIDYDRIFDMLKLEDGGYPSMLDEVIVNARQYASKSSLDVYIIVYSSVQSFQNAVNNQFMVWNVTAWNQAAWANLNYTDLVSNPKRIILNKQSYYFQIRLRNNRDELCEVYSVKIKGRASGMSG